MSRDFIKDKQGNNVKKAADEKKGCSAGQLPEK
jgi:hypothetical protein